jgi:hypothetical protein
MSNSKLTPALPSSALPGLSSQGNGHGKQINATENAFTSDALVEQEGQQEADDQTGDQEYHGEDNGVAQIDLKTLVGKQFLIVAQPGEGEIGQELIPFAERGVGGEADETIHKDSDGDHRRREQQD